MCCISKLDYRLETTVTWEAIHLLPSNKLTL